MAVRSGLGAQLGVATEETYGTFKAPTRFFPFTTESIALSKNYVKSAGLRAGRLSQASTLHRATTRSAAGDFNIEFFDQGMGILLNQLHGEVVTPVKIEEKSKLLFKQIHKIGLSDPFGKSMTVQVGRPDVTGTVRPFSYLGCKITEYKLSIDAGGLAQVSVSIDGRDEVTAEALGSATYDADPLPFTFQQMEAKIGGSKVANVRSITITVAVGQNTERFNLGNSGVKDTPIVNELLAVTANATMEFSGLTDHERFTKEELKELVLNGKGAEPGAEAKGDNFTANFKMAAAKQTSSSPTVDGPDVITQDVAFECLDNFTSPPLEAEILSTDTTI
jgi:hypothetical protein